MNNDTQLDIVVANNGTGSIGIFFGRGDGSFLPQTIYSISSNSHTQFVAVGDLDNDKALDIVVVDSQNDHLHVLRGAGNGSFSTIATYDTAPGSVPFCMAIADFDNDNQSDDIVVVNKGAQNVLVATNFWSERAIKQKNYKDRRSIGEGPLAVGDFNNDGIFDIVSVTQRTMSVLTGLSDGTFNWRETIDLDPNLSASQYISVGDLNNDNRMDFVTVLTNSDVVAVFLGHGDGTFSTMTTYSTGVGSNPWRTVLADFNGDDRLDIVSMNKGSKTIGILIGNGDGTFTTVRTHPTVDKHTPYSVLAVDLNKDNHLDLIVGDDRCSLTVFLGFGNGSFYTWNIYLTFDRCILSSIALFDYNHDGYPDVVTASPSQDSIRWYLGAKNATFSKSIPWAFPHGTQSLDIGVVDFNEDNRDDLLIANFGTDTIVVFYRSEKGQLTFGTQYSTGYGSKPYMIAKANSHDKKQSTVVVQLWGTKEIAVLTSYYAARFHNEENSATGTAFQPVSLVTGDFNSDNRSDIVVVNAGTDDLHLLFGSSIGSLSLKQAYAIGNNSSPQYVIACDIDRDNQLDIISVNSNDDSISVIRGRGNGTFAEQLKYHMGVGSQPHAVASGDLNNDNRLDLVVANTGTDSLSILFGFNYTSFVNPTRSYMFGNGDSVKLVVNDLNNDGILDIAVSLDISGQVGVLLGYGNGTFTLVSNYSIGTYARPSGIAAGDFNNDNRSDVVVAVTAANYMGILFGCGNGSFLPILTYSIGHLSYPSVVVTKDLNHDNQLDIVLITQVNSSVGVLLGYGNGSFSMIKTYATGESVLLQSIGIGDVDNDGHLDIVVADSGSNIRILIGNENGTFDDTMTFSIISHCGLNFVTVADLDNDNQADIIAVSSSRNNIIILFGFGNGTFADIRIYSTGDGSQPNSASISDFNSDSILDLAVANSGTSNILVLFGNGDGRFRNDTAQVYYFGYGYHPYSIVATDMNGDGWMDIVVACQGTDHVEILMQIC